jgi:hypothetical protein
MLSGRYSMDTLNSTFNVCFFCVFSRRCCFGQLQYRSERTPIFLQPRKHPNCGVRNKLAYCPSHGGVDDSFFRSQRDAGSIGPRWVEGQTDDALYADGQQYTDCATLMTPPLHGNIQFSIGHIMPTSDPITLKHAPLCPPCQTVQKM